MRHRRKSEKFNRSRAERKAFIRSMIRAVLISERIVTTESKGKGLRPWVEKMITWGKRGDLHAKRLAFNVLQDHALVSKLFDDIAPRFKDINGGYTRVLDVGFRKGDGAEMAILELTKMKPKSEITKKSEAKKATRTRDAADAPAVSEGKKKKSMLDGVKKIFKKKD